MTMMRHVMIGVLAVGLAACGGAEDSADAGDQAAASEFAGVIDARQQSLKDLGGAFKKISDQLRSGDPDTAEIQAAAATAAGIANKDFPSWFPEGSGAESGLDTDALASIWSEGDDFVAAHDRLKSAAAELNDAAQTGDAAEIEAKFRAMGGACKNCHDQFRRDDD